MASTLRVPGAYIGVVEAGELVAPIFGAERSERVSFEQILETHQRGVLRLCLRMLGDPEDARDGAQEVFLKAFRSLDQLRSDHPVRPWLYQIAVNVCRDRLRKRRPVEALEGEPVQPGLNPEALASQDERRRLLLMELRSLPEAEREALVLRDLEGMETSEVARLLGKTEATVRSQVFKARAKLRARLQRLL